MRGGTIETMKNPMHIIVLGQEGVGKSALTVRFLTRRFLSEFADTTEISYERTVTLDGNRQVSLRITDVSGKPFYHELSVIIISTPSVPETDHDDFQNASKKALNEDFTKLRHPNSLQTRAASRELLMQADAAVLVYSVTDQSSVTAARHALGCIRKYRPAVTTLTQSVMTGNRRAESAGNITSCTTSPLPVLLLGNKSDLDHIRTVQRHKDCADWTSDNTLTSECSARDDADGVTLLFHKLIRKVLEIRDVSLRGKRKLSQGVLGSPSQLRTTIRRRLSMFSRDRVSTL